MATRPCLCVAFCLLFSFFSANFSRAQVSTSFDTGVENWLVTGSNTVAWFSSGGNPDGYMRSYDLDGNELNRASAPPQYLGDWSGMSETDTLSVDYYFDNFNSFPLFDNGYIFRIDGPGGSAYALPGSSNAPPHLEWATRKVAIKEEDWVVTSGHWDDLVRNVTALLISLEFVSGTEYVGIDNVSLASSPVPVFNECVSSTFNSDLIENWMLKNDWEYSVTAGGGNGAGYLYVEDGTGNTYAYAPGAFLGDWTPLNEIGSIMVDIRMIYVNGTNVGSPDFIRISGPGGAAYVSVDPSELPVDRRCWKTFTYPIDSLTWTMEYGTWSGLLNFVTECRVDLEYISGGEYIGMDNFARVTGDCSPIDNPVGTEVLDLWPCGRLSFIQPSAIAYNPADSLLYGLVYGTPAEGGSVYRMSGDDPGERLQSYDRPANLIFDTDGDAFVSEVIDGVVNRLAWGGGTSIWVSGFHSGDDDPVGMGFAPAGFNGPNVNEGDILVADIGSSGPDEIWAFSPDSSEYERLVLPDPGEVDLYDIASSSGGEVFVCDALVADSLYRLHADGTLHGFALSSPVTDMRSMVYDERNDLIYVADRGDMSVKRVDPSTGEVTEAADGFAELPTGCLEIDPVRNILWIADKGYNRIYEFCLQPPSGVANRAPQAVQIRNVKVVPNPFNPVTSIHFDLDQSTVVAINIYDVAGRRIRTLVNEKLAEGHNVIAWNGRDNAGGAVASGVYFAKLTAEGRSHTTRLVLIR